MNKNILILVTLVSLIVLSSCAARTPSGCVTETYFITEDIMGEEIRQHKYSSSCPKNTAYTHINNLTGINETKYQKTGFPCVKYDNETVEVKIGEQQVEKQREKCN